MTLEGKEKLDKRLYDLIHKERPAVIKAIEEARAHGDLSENADYDAAKEKQGLIEARIKEAQGKLANAEVCDTSKLSSDVVIFGAYVRLLDVEREKEVEYQLVGEDEADLSQGKISIFAPLSALLVGKKKGEIVLHHLQGEL